MTTEKEFYTDEELEELRIQGEKEAELESMDFEIESFIADLRGQDPKIIDAVSGLLSYYSQYVAPQYEDLFIETAIDKLNDLKYEQ